MVQDARYPEGQMLGWTPGQAPHAAPNGLQWRLEPGSDLVLQLHLQPSGRPEPLRVSVAFYFTDAPPTRTPLGLRLGSETIDLAAGASDAAIADRYVLPVDVQVLAVQPHAHNLARHMEADAVRPDGVRVPLIEIDDWDFRWQDIYRYRTPITLPKGTTIAMRYTYDNSADNPRNPHHPPAHVVWGQKPSDEMGDLWLQVVPVNEQDASALGQDFRRKANAEDLAAYTKLLREDERNPLRHDAVASLSFDAGRLSDAVTHYRRSLELNPDSASTHYNLGIAYSAMGDRDHSRVEFAEAVRLDPGYAQAHNNLGAVLYLAGDVDGARSEYERAVVLRPDNVEARTNLAALLSAHGYLREALDQYEAALNLRSDSVAALSGIAWIRATAWDAALLDGDKAMTFALRADALAHHRDLAVLDALAAAYAQASRFDDAVSVAESASSLAISAGLAEAAARFADRRAQYQRRQVFRVSPPDHK